jgi:hypothetical protein
MMLEFLGEADAAGRIHKAIEATDQVSGNTNEIAAAIRDAL